MRGREGNKREMRERGKKGKKEEEYERKMKGGKRGRNGRGLIGRNEKRGMERKGGSEVR